MGAEPNEQLPFLSLDKTHRKLGPRNTDEYAVYGAKTLVVDQETGRIKDSRDIVYKEFKLTKEELPQGVTLEDYAKGLKDLYTLVRSYYPEVVQTSYIIAKNHESEDCILAVQPLQAESTALDILIRDPSLKPEIDQTAANFNTRWSKVTNDPRWGELPDCITSTRVVPDFKANNFIRSKDGKYTIFDW